MLTCPKVTHLVMEELKHRPNVSNFTDLKVDAFSYKESPDAGSQERPTERGFLDMHTPRIRPWRVRLMR